MFKKLKKLIAKTLLFAFILLLSLLLATLGHFYYVHERFPQDTEDLVTMKDTLTKVFEESEKIARGHLKNLEKEFELEEKGEKIAKNWDQMLSQYEDAYTESHSEQSMKETIKKSDHDEEFYRKYMAELKEQKRKKKLAEKGKKDPGQVRGEKSSSVPEDTSSKEGKKQGEKTGDKEKDPQDNSRDSNDREKEDDSNTDKKADEKKETRDPQKSEKSDSQQKEGKSDLPSGEKKESEKEKKGPSPEVLFLLKKGTIEFQKGRKNYKEAYKTDDKEKLRQALKHFRTSLEYLEKAREKERDPQRRAKIEELIDLTGKHVADCVRMTKMN